MKATTNFSERNAKTEFSLHVPMLSSWSRSTEELTMLHRTMIMRLDGIIANNTDNKDMSDLAAISKRVLQLLKPNVFPNCGFQ